MNALVDALISHPGESIVVTSALLLIVILLSIVRVAGSWRADRRRRQARAVRPRYGSGTPARRPAPPIDQTRVMARQFPARPDDMTAVQYVIDPIERWGGRRG